MNFFELMRKCLQEIGPPMHHRHCACWEDSSVSRLLMTLQASVLVVATLWVSVHEKKLGGLAFGKRVVNTSSQEPVWRVGWK